MKFGILAAGFALGAFLLSGCELGSAPTGGGTGAEGLTGIIVDRSGNPVRGARVWIAPTATGSLNKRGAFQVAFKRDSTVTNRSGRYYFRGLAAGHYDVAATFTRNDTTFSLVARYVGVEGDAEAGKDTVLPAATLSTFVGDIQGTPIRGATCSVAEGPWLATTDSTGTCVLRGIASGDFVLLVTAPGKGTVPTSTYVTSGDQAAECRVYVRGPDGEVDPTN